MACVLCFWRTTIDHILYQLTVDPPRRPRRLGPATRKNPPRAQGAAGADREGGHTGSKAGENVGTSVEFWMNLQSQYDADIAREAIGDDLESIEPFALQA